MSRVRRGATAHSLRGAAVAGIGVGVARVSGGSWGSMGASTVTIQPTTGGPGMPPSASLTSRNDTWKTASGSPLSVASPAITRWMPETCPETPYCDSP